MSDRAGDLVLCDAAEEICRQLCRVAAGDLDVRLDAPSEDTTAQKLALLGNGVLHVARRAIAAAEATGRELAEAHRVARLGTWRLEVLAGVPRRTLSAELRTLLGIGSAATSGDPLLDAVVHPDDRERVKGGEAQALAGSASSFEWRAVMPDGTERMIWTEIRPDGVHAGMVQAVCQDITERRAAEARIRQLAETDALTGLSNRTVLRERLTAALAHAGRRRGQHGLAVLCVDLDGFKGMNDRHGHPAGDRVLVQAAARMRGLTRGGDTLSRLGGDEFAIVQESPDQPAAAERLARRLADALATPYDLGNGTLHAAITASIGVAVAPGDGETVDALLAAADAALYGAKAAGRNGVSFYRPQMEADARERRELEEDLRQAAERGELSLAYQPLVAVRDGRVLGYEALMRWRHPTRGHIPPDRFVAVAEASGQIHRIGEWALQVACEEAARWREPRFIAVNVSPIQVQRGPAFAEAVEAALAASGLAPERLELEVTEGVLIRDADAALAALRRVRDLGVRVALDDFGTGYSSLATLQAFPFDKIKIDRRFVSGLGGASAQDAAIVRAVLGLAAGLGIPVVAEGVETQPQLDSLRTEGCAEAQGWLFGRPSAPPSSVLSDATCKVA